MERRKMMALILCAKHGYLIWPFLSAEDVVRCLIRCIFFYHDHYSSLLQAEESTQLDFSKILSHNGICLPCYLRPLNQTYHYILRVNIQVHYVHWFVFFKKCLPLFYVHAANHVRISSWVPDTKHHKCFAFTLCCKKCKYGDGDVSI